MDRIFRSIKSLSIHFHTLDLTVHKWEVWVWLEDLILAEKKSFAIVSAVLTGALFCMFFLRRDRKGVSKKLIDAYRRAQLLLVEKMKSTDTYALFLRLAWSDAATYDKSVSDWPRCGGANGRIRFDHELDYKENHGLVVAVTLLERCFAFNTKKPTLLCLAFI